MDLIDSEMIYAPVEGPTPEKRKDIEIIDPFAKEESPKNGLWMKDWILEMWS